MADWASKESVMSEEHDLLLQLLKLLKKEQASNMATLAALPLISPQKPKLRDEFQEEFLALKADQKANVERHVDARYRQFETALKNGTDYWVPLRELLKRHGPDS
jgi:hypothetical protein